MADTKDSPSSQVFPDLPVDLPQDAGALVPAQETVLPGEGLPYPRGEVKAVADSVFHKVVPPKERKMTLPGRAPDYPMRGRGRGRGGPSRQASRPPKGSRPSATGATYAAMAGIHPKAFIPEAAYISVPGDWANINGVTLPAAVVSSLGFEGAHRLTRLFNISEGAGLKPDEAKEFELLMGKAGQPKLALVGPTPSGPGSFPSLPQPVAVAEMVALRTLREGEKGLPMIKRPSKHLSDVSPHWGHDFFMSSADADAYDSIRAYYDETTGGKYTIEDMVFMRRQAQKEGAPAFLAALEKRLRGQVAHARNQILDSDLKSISIRSPHTVSDGEITSLMLELGLPQSSTVFLLPEMEDFLLRIPVEALRLTPKQKLEMADIKFLEENISRPKLKPGVYDPNVLTRVVRSKPFYFILPPDLSFIKNVGDAVIARAREPEGKPMVVLYTQLYNKLVEVARNTQFGQRSARGQIIRHVKCREIHHWALAQPSRHVTRLNKAQMVQQYGAEADRDKEQYMVDIREKLNEGTITQKRATALMGSWSSRRNELAMNLALENSLVPFILNMNQYFPLATLHMRNTRIHGTGLFTINKTYSQSVFNVSTPWGEQKVLRDYNFVDFNPNSGSGPLYEGQPHKEVSMGEIYTASLLMTDHDSDMTDEDILRKWSWLALAFDKDKLEAYPGDRPDDRNIAATTFAGFIPAQVLFAAAFKRAPNAMHSANSSSLLGFCPFFGEFELFLNVARYRTVPTAREQAEAKSTGTPLKFRITFFVFADNLYAYVFDPAAGEYWMSWDGSKMEACHRPEDFINFCYMVAAGYGVSFRPRKAGDKRGSSLSEAWVRYLTQFLPWLLSNLTVTLGGRQIVLGYLGSGCVGTGQMNTAKMVTAIPGLLRAIGVLSDMGPLPSEQGLVGGARVYRDLDAKQRFIGRAKEALDHATIQLKFELAVQNPFAGLTSPFTRVPMDLLGFDAISFQMFDLPAVVLPVLAEDRLLKSVLYRKAFSRLDPSLKEVQKDFNTPVHSWYRVAALKAIYLVGGWSDPALAGAIRGMIRRDYVNMGIPLGSEVPVSDEERHSLFTDIMGLAGEQVPGLDEHSFKSFISKADVPSFQDVLAVLAHGKGVRTPFGVVSNSFLRRHFLSFTILGAPPVGLQEVYEDASAARLALAEGKGDVDYVALAKVWAGMQLAAREGAVLGRGEYSEVDAYVDLFSAAVRRMIPQEDWGHFLATTTEPVFGGEFEAAMFADVEPVSKLPEGLFTPATHRAVPTLKVVGERPADAPALEGAKISKKKALAELKDLTPAEQEEALTRTTKYLSSIGAFFDKEAPGVSLFLPVLDKNAVDAISQGAPTVKEAFRSNSLNAAVARFLTSLRVSKVTQAMVEKVLADLPLLRKKLLDRLETVQAWHSRMNGPTRTKTGLDKAFRERAVAFVNPQAAQQAK